MALKDYYRTEEARSRRESGRTPVKPIKKYCWVKRTTVRFMDGRCMLEGCPDIRTEGCLQVIV